MNAEVLSSKTTIVTKRRSLKDLNLTIVFLLLLSSSMVFAQISPSTNQNYVISRSIKYPITNPDDINSLNEFKISEVVKYYNSLGKPSQVVNYKYYTIGENSKDLVTYIEYDDLGIESISYLPYSNTASGSFRTDAKTAQGNFYNAPPSGVTGSAYPFAVSLYEKSPLLRTIQQGFVGESWQPNEQYPLNANTIKVYNQANSLSEVLHFGIDEGIDVNITCSGYYWAGSLYKTKTVDENQVESYVFKDKNDKEILKVTSSENGLIKTYYVYDKYDRLRFILPPEASSSNYLSNPSFPITIDKNHELRKSWITEFKYDGLNRQVEKIMPEEQPVWTIYDPAGRVILRQDGIMRENNDWLFYKYDRKGRVILSGIWRLMGYWENRDEAQQFINSNVGPGKAYSFFEEHTVNDDLGYTNNAFPPNDHCEFYTKNYYDHYDSNNDGIVDAVFRTGIFDPEDYDEGNYKISGHSAFYRINDKLTISKVLLFGTKGTSLVFNGDKDYSFNPPSPETIYYKGNVRLLPGFKTYPDQQVYIGPNIVVPQGTGDGKNEYLTTYNFYDKYGRVIQTQSQNHLGGTDTASTQYEFAGKVIRTKQTHTTEYGSVTVNDRFEYDHTGRILKTFKKIGNGNEVLVAHNEYNELGQLITKKLHSTNSGSTFLQKVDYRYNIRGWLKSVNNPYNISETGYNNDVFEFKLHYEDLPDAGILHTAQYNGNISAMVWNHNNNSTMQSVYSYYYDKLNRLTNADYGLVVGSIFEESNYYKEYNITYDKNGKILSLKRNAFNGVLMDDLIYDYTQPGTGNYKGNRLFKVTDNATSSLAYDFKDGINASQEYDYDFNGNMKKDLNKGINIEYNYLNLPVTIKWNANNPSDKRKIEWLYDAAGSKLRKTVYNENGEAVNVINYANGFVYNTNYGDALPQLSFFPMSEGRVVSLSATEYELQYWMKDHLGNTRVAFRDNGSGTPEVIQKDFYYPFGLTVNLSTTGDENKFKYNGKELEDENGLWWYHYGVRYYDPQLGRWHTMDPADEFHSPYVYVGNNPVNFIDPDGTQAIAPFIAGNGSIWLTAGNSSKFIRPVVQQTSRLSKNIDRSIPKETPQRYIKPEWIPPEPPLQETWFGKMARLIADGLSQFLPPFETVINVDQNANSNVTEGLPDNLIPFFDNGWIDKETNYIWKIDDNGNLYNTGLLGG